MNLRFTIMNKPVIIHKHHPQPLPEYFSVILLTMIMACFAFIPAAVSQEEQVIDQVVAAPVLQEEQVIDQVVAVVGKSIILESDIQNQFLNARMQGRISGAASEMRCSILEDILYQKLMVTQAEVDSLEVNDIQVEGELDRRLGSFIQQFGSQDKLEQYYGKTLSEIKQELRDVVGEQLLAQQVQQGIVANVTVTPSEIRTFYRSIPKDSLPLIKTEYKIAEVVKMPPVNIE